MKPAYLLRYLVFIAIVPAITLLGTNTSSALAANTPVLVVAQGLDDTTVQLTWMAVSGASSYAIYRNGGLVTSQIGTLYNDAALTPATQYSYQVSATVNGVASPLSPAVSATTQAAGDTSSPTTPGAVTVSGISSSGATLKWSASSDNVGVLGYRILRGAAGAPLSALIQIATAENSTSYTAANLKAATSYQFAVLALDAGNNLSSAQTVTFKTSASSDTTAPSAPASSSVIATAFSSSRIDIVWGASSSSDTSGYQIFRDGTLVGKVDLPLRRYYSDNGLTAGSTHSYQIRTIDSAKNLSALTTAVSATTLGSGVVKIVRGPYIQETTMNSTRIAWWTNIAAPSTVSYGLGNLSGQVNDAALTMQHVMLIGGLTAGTIYSYQVASGNATGPTATFETAPPPGSTFTFAGVGDFGGGSPQETRIANDIASDGTQFTLTLGDNVYPDASDPNFATTYSDFDARFYKPYATVMRVQTLWLAGGNHEYYGNEAFWQNIWMPNNERWYSFDWGDAHILVLDTESPYTPGTPQYQFAQNDLAANQSKIWRIVVCHRPPYSSTSSVSSATGVRTYLVPLFEQQKVQLVLTGHSHNYERTYPLLGGVRQTSGGVTYIVSGGGGNGLNAFTISKPSWSAFRLSGYENLLITVAPGSLQLEAINDTGSIIDSATINSGSAATPTATNPPVATNTPTSTPTPTVVNPPTATNTPTPTPTSGIHTPIFSDGFESGNLSAWTSSGGLTVQSASVHSGTFAAQGNTTNGATYAKKLLPTTYNNGFARIYFNLVSFSSQVNLLRYRTAADASMTYLFVNTSGQLGLRNDIAATTTTSATAVSSGWHALEFHVVCNGASSTTEVWLDGVKLNDLSITTNLGANLIGKIQIGEVSTGRTYNVIFDDVIFDIQRIGL